jgi:hypothetical protein
MSALNFFSRQLREDPLRTYERARAEPGLHRTPVGTWVASRFDDVRQVLTSPAASSRVWAMAATPSDSGSGPLFDPSDRAHAVTELMRHWLPFTDAPQHTALRRALREPLRRHAARLRPIIDDIVAEEVHHLPRTGVVDVATSIARQVPQRVGGALLGLSAEQAEIVAPWSADAARALSPFIGRRDLARIHASCAALTSFASDLVAERRARPADDLVSDLVAAQPEHGLSDADVAALVLFVIVASQETTSAVLASALHLLAGDQARLDELRSSGAWRAAAEESMRLHSPVQMTMRRMTTAVDVGGTHVAAGDHVLAVLASGNRDPEAFTDPDTFDLQRPSAPSHLAFGAGAHQCPGAAIAHLELESALRAITDRSPRILPAGEPTWQWSLTLRSLSSLPIRFG